MHYPILNALPHALPYIFSEICLVLGNLQRVTTRYRQIYKKHVYYFFKKIDGNALQIAQNQANLSMVTRSSHGNPLHYGPTTSVEFENLLYPKVASYKTQIQSDFTSLPTCFFQIN